MSTQYQMHTQLPRQHSSGKHVLAFLAMPAVVFVAAYVAWTMLKEQCASALTTTTCMPVGSAELGGSDVALLATFLAAGIAAIIEVASN